jgi:hypothetical protein
MHHPRYRLLVGLTVVLCLLGVSAFAGMIGKMYVKRTEWVLTERSGQVCRSEGDNYCERNYQCPGGKVAQALIYNIKEEKGRKRLSGLSLVCADPNVFSDPVIVGAAGDNFAGEVINDYCPVGYLLAGADFYTGDRTNIGGARRICRRYQPPDQRLGPNLYGEGFDSMRNLCPPDHWVTGIKISFTRTPKDGAPVDSSLLNARFYCGEVRHWLVEPSREELDALTR